jgi:hypothetical protein
MNVSKLLKIQKKNLEIVWDTKNPNKIFRAHENIFGNFKKMV